VLLLLGGEVLALCHDKQPAETHQPRPFNSPNAQGLTLDIIVIIIIIIIFICLEINAITNGVTGSQKSHPAYLTGCL